jgi:hypothetical protein
MSYSDAELNSLDIFTRSTDAGSSFEHPINVKLMARDLPPPPTLRLSSQAEAIGEDTARK